MIKYKKILFICLLIIYGFSFAFVVHAESWVTKILGTELIRDDCRLNGNCDLNDFIRVAVNLFRLMLGVLGSLALLFFIYGGIIFLLSRGNPTMVQRGKSILTQSLVGIMIVLGSWFIVALVIAALTGQELGASIKLFGQEWWRLKQ